jgi:hypothetical protein
MGRTGRTLLFAAPVAAGVVVAVARRRRDARQRAARRAHVITVYKPLSELDATQLPGSLRQIADQVEIHLATAPAGRGTEIAVRIPDRSPITGGEARRALRETRSLLEAGDVLLPSGPATTTPTPLNRPLQSITRNGREGGLR